MLKLNLTNAKQRVFFGALIALLMCAFFAIWSLVGFTSNWTGERYNEDSAHWAEYDQYARMGDALLHGRLDLDLPVADFLETMKDPYQTSKRVKLAQESDQRIYWDHAYYKGKYYMYFGVVPAALLYAPYQLVTGSWLNTTLAVLLLGLTSVLGLSLLVLRIAQVFFRDQATVTSTAMALCVMFAGSNLGYLGIAPLFYSIPILSSLCCTSFGLYLWLGAKLKAQTGDNPSLSVSRLAIGSFLMALNLGCRPQFMLAFALAFPLFWDEIIHKRILFSRASIMQSCATVLPFVIVSVPLLLYNHARFGSPFDFGSSYNLTGFNMTNYHQDWRTTAEGLYMFLIQGVDFSSTFPFVKKITADFANGWAPHEPMFGGYFCLIPSALLCVLFPLALKARKRDVFAFAAVALVCAAIVLVVDMRIAGVTQRYFGDFGWYICLVVALVVFSFDALADTNARGFVVARKVVLVLVGISLVYSAVVGCLSFFNAGRYYAVKNINPQLYSFVRGLFG